MSACLPPCKSAVRRLTQLQVRVMADEDEELDPAVPPALHLVSAFLAMEPTDVLLSLSRECDRGLLTERVQRFVWHHCIKETEGKGYLPYLKNFVKRLIFEIESQGGSVMDELYEQYSYYMTSVKDDHFVRRNVQITKCISFIFPYDSCSEFQSCPVSSKLVVPLHCSLNMLEGDTGCSVWPSSLYLSEFILSYPDIFSKKSCFEVGSGVGLVGICLSHVKASEVILTDGDLSTLANMKLNLELNKFRTETDGSKSEDPNMVKCIHLPWETTMESELQKFTPDIVLGADIIYDPSCLPHLIRVLATLLNQTRTCSRMGTEERSSGPSSPNREFDRDSSNAGVQKGPLAYIASVIRNMDTFNTFLQLAEQADLVVTDLTQSLSPSNLLPYMLSFNRSSIRLFAVTPK